MCMFNIQSNSWNRTYLHLKTKAQLLLQVLKLVNLAHRIATSLQLHGKKYQRT